MLDALRSQLEQEAGKLAEKILDGTCVDMSQYKARVHERKGLLRAVAVINETQRKAEDEDWPE